MKLIQVLLVFALFALIAIPVQGRIGGPPTEKVLVVRLVGNLEKSIAANPTNASLHSNLARLHSMAYAQKTDQLDARSDANKNYWPVFRYPGSDHLLPRGVTKAESDEAQTAAKEHLKLAIAGYEKALTLDPKQLTARLGLGWCFDQSGDKTNALTHYRKALAQAWEAESKRGGFGKTDMLLTSETVDDMLPLLDPKKDAEEIVQIKSYKAAVLKMPRSVSPILIPLEANQPFADLINPSAAVTFDLDGSGLPRQWGWITPKAAWLVYDSDDSHVVISGLQLFGNVTFWAFWNNGYEALSALDNNGDGELSGDELEHLALWHDANGNGVSDPGEIKPLVAWNISGLSCRSQTHSTGIPFHPSGVMLKDGSTRPSYDWFAPRCVSGESRP